jgi:Mrp family chromosome partitioning ATPase
MHRLHATLKLRSVMVSEQAASQNGAPAPVQRPPRVILVTSPDPGDGKSTVTAELALVQRDAGERVAVIDANMRRPAQARLLGVDAAPGLAEVLSGTLAHREAMREVATAGPPAPAPGAGGGVATAVGSRVAGSIAVLASGAPGASPYALLAREAMAQLLAALSEEYDFVLIDGPSPLEVSDVLPLLSLVDGVLAVARVAHTREPSARRLAQLLREEARTPLLGVVANCVAPKQVQRYGLSSSNGTGWTHALLRR